MQFFIILLKLLNDILLNLITELTILDTENGLREIAANLTSLSKSCDVQITICLFILASMVNRLLGSYKDILLVTLMNNRYD